MMTDSKAIVSFFFLSPPGFLISLIMYVYPRLHALYVESGEKHCRCRYIGFGVTPEYL